MKLGDGLFLNTCRRVAEEYKDSGITFSDMMWVAALSTRGCHPRKLTRETDSPGSVDNTSMQLVNRPQQFDVMVMPNLYGSIVSNIGAALVGGPGIVPGANIGREYALFEPGCRHVAKDIQGQDVANPAAMVLSSTMVSSLRALISFLVLVGRGSRIVDGEPRPPPPAVQLLRHLGLDFHANAIAKATYDVLSEGKIRCVPHTSLLYGSAKFCGNSD